MIFQTELSSLSIVRYPRTQHIEGSRYQAGDTGDFATLASLRGANVVIEEKLDGANSGCSFTSGAELLLQSRGHYLTGSARERQFAPLRLWASAHESALLERLEDRYLMFGEWCHAKHSVFYDLLPHRFFEFDIWDREDKVFLSTPRRRVLLSGSPVMQVPVLYEGLMPTTTQGLNSLIGRALAKSLNWRDSLGRVATQQKLSLDMVWQQTDKSDLAEGLYLKVEDDWQVLGRYKLVRESFTQTILDSGSHHASRPILPNQLHPDADLLAPAPTVTWEDLGLHTLRELPGPKPKTRRFK